MSQTYGTVPLKILRLCGDPDDFSHRAGKMKYILSGCAFPSPGNYVFNVNPNRPKDYSLQKKRASGLPKALNRARKTKSVSLASVAFLISIARDATVFGNTAIIDENDR